MPWLSRLIRNSRYEIDFNEVNDSLERLNHLTEKLESEEQKIRERENKLSDLANSLEVAIWAKDIDNKFIYANRACLRLILHTDDEAVIGVKDTDFSNNLLADACIASDEITKSRGKTCRFIEHCRYPNGSDFWFDTMKSPRFYGTEIIGTVGSGVDITSNIPIEIRDEYTTPTTVEIPLDWGFDISLLRKLLAKEKQ